MLHEFIEGLKKTLSVKSFKNEIIYDNSKNGVYYCNNPLFFRNQILRQHFVMSTYMYM